MRDFYLEFGVRVADGEVDNDHAGYMAGSRVNIGQSQESLDQLIDLKAEYLKDALRRLREEEEERDRQAAKPFWNKWLGGV